MSTAKTAPESPSAPCPCGLGRPYGQCCGPLHAGAPAADAQALMRSRYCAYVLGDADYVRASWHPDTRPDELDLGDAGATRWLGLEVKRHVAIDADHATVEFVARYKPGGAPAVRLHELSRFVREDGRWFYVDGVFPDK
jgi:SEC-C motif-containing protein